MFPKWSDWDLQYTRKGLVKQQVTQALRLLLLVAVVVGAFGLRQGGSRTYPRLQDFSMLVQRSLKQGLMAISALVNRGITMLSE